MWGVGIGKPKKVRCCALRLALRTRPRVVRGDVPGVRTSLCAARPLSLRRKPSVAIPSDCATHFLTSHVDRNPWHEAVQAGSCPWP
eukprot:3677267-Pyramimonas_sp.AAC.2